MVKLRGGGPTFVLEEIAHLRTASKDKLSDIFDDLRFILWRERDEPFR